MHIIHGCIMVLCSLNLVLLFHIQLYFPDIFFENTEVLAQPDLSQATSILLGKSLSPFLIYLNSSLSLLWTVDYQDEVGYIICP